MASLDAAMQSLAHRGRETFVSAATTQEHVVATRAMLLAGFTILVYDHLLTLEHEVRGVWKAKWGVVKVVFLLNRYIVPLMLMVDIYEQFFMPDGDSPMINAFCKYWTTIQSYLTIASFAGIHALVALRVYALHGGSKGVGFVLWAAGVLYVILCLGILTFGLISLLPHSNGIHALHGCIGAIPSWLWTLWLPSVVFEGFIFYLTVRSAMVQATADGFHPVALILYRDGILYFLAMTGCSLFSLIVWATAGSTLIGLARYFALALVNVAGSRIVLNLRVYAAAKKEATDEAEAELERQLQTKGTNRTSATSNWSNLVTPTSSVNYVDLPYDKPPPRAMAPEHFEMQPSNKKTPSSYHYVKRASHGQAAQNWVRGLSTGLVDQQLQTYTSPPSRTRNSVGTVREPTDPREIALAQFYGYPTTRRSPPQVAVNTHAPSRSISRTPSLTRSPATQGPQLAIAAPRPQRPEHPTRRPSAPEPITPTSSAPMLPAHMVNNYPSYPHDLPPPPRSATATPKTIHRKPPPSLGLAAAGASGESLASPSPSQQRISTVSTTDTIIGGEIDGEGDYTSSYMGPRPPSDFSGAQAV